MPVSSSHHRPPSYVTCRLLAPCRRALTRLFRVPASAALSIRAFRFRSLRKDAATMSPQHRRHRRRKFQSVRAIFWPLVPPPSSTPAASAVEDETGRGSAVTTELLAAQEAPPSHAPVSSPETPAYVKVVARLWSGQSTASGDDEDDDDDREKKEEACRCFESCLMEMLVEEGKAKDLQDVEELLRCWERLKSPVFVDLVCRFYGELCNDMFPATGGEDDTDRNGGDDASVSASGS